MATIISDTPYVKVIQERLQNDGFELSQTTIVNMPALVATTTEFKASWFATQLNIFIVVGVADRVEENTINSFSKSAIEFALQHYGGPRRGMQTGVVCFALLITPSIDEKAKLWVMQRPRKHFAAFEMPCLLDTSTNNLYFYQQTPIWGFIYYRSFRQVGCSLSDHSRAQISFCVSPGQ
jgi:hypothetical protein